MKKFLNIARTALLISGIILGNIPYSFAQNWDQIIKANASDRNVRPHGVRSEGDVYSSSVSVWGDYAVVGSLGEDEDQNGANMLKTAGAAYILYRTNGKWKQIKKICPSVRTEGGHFGHYVAINGDYVVVGAYAESKTGPSLPNLNYSGAAYIFRKDEGGEDNWGEVKRITASTPLLGATFGISVAIDGDYVVVGAAWEGENTGEANQVLWMGAAYVFKKNHGGTDNWGLIKKLVEAERKEFNEFGACVAISGDNILVGAPFEEIIKGSTVGEDAGAAYIFNKSQGGSDNWGEVAKILPSVPAVDYGFGGCLGISGNYVVVGHTRGYRDNMEKQAAYIFEKNEGGTNHWGMIKKLSPPVLEDRDAFAHTIAISGDYIIVGALGEDENSNEQNRIEGSGSAFIYKRTKGGNNNWGLLKKITASYRGAGDIFGAAVAISGETALVGAESDWDDENEANPVKDAGSAYFFQANKGGADNWGFEKKSVMEELSPDDHFGYSVAISGNYAVVGSPNEDEGRYWQNSALDAGAAYVFFNDAGTWKLVTKLLPSIRWAHDNFGASVAIEGKFIVVGAPQGDLNGIEEVYREDAGAAYVFYLESGEHNWQQVKKLVASNRNTGDHFGASVSINGNKVIIGSPGTDGGSGIHDYGSAYVFAKDQGSENNWGQMQELTAASRHDYAGFGRSVSISSEYAIVGADGDIYNDNVPSLSGIGAAYIFQNGLNGVRAWGLLKKIHATTPTFGDRFGYSVALSGNYAIVGAFGDSENSLEADFKSHSGAAYIFKKDAGGQNNWGNVKKITAITRYADDNFGSVVSISGQYAMVGTPGGDLNIIEESYAQNSGAAYIFRKNLGGADNWGQTQKLTAYNRRGGVQFGSSLAINDTYAIVGSPFDDKDATEQNTLEGAGSMFIFHTSSAPLPVILATFNAEKNEKSALISWTTTAETNADHFEVEKSADAKTWKSIGEVAAGAESKELLSYFFTDNDPFSGNNFYRLKMVDQDGTSAYSRIRSLSFENFKSIGVYPNPVVDRLYINADQLSQVESVRVLNAFGQTVSNTSKITVNGLVMENLTNGIYIIQIKRKDGKMQNERVAVVR